MDFISNKKAQLAEMLREIGVDNVEELFQAIPKSLILKRPSFDDGISEYEGIKMMEALAKKNRFSEFDSYLGAGAYEHYIPAIVPFLCSKSEFLTSYTPYQAESSQGMLQSIFEYQSAICALTGMDASNASVYDAASASAEALLMALRVNKGRKKIAVAMSLHPHYRSVIDVYLKRHCEEIVWVPFGQDGRVNLPAFNKIMDDSIAAFLIQSPNFFGAMENTKELAAITHRYDGLTILSANPLSFGIYASAKELEVDIAIGDCQPFGLPLAFGGPYCGYMACKEALIRQLPGRIVGETVDTKGKRGFVLTLQAREQHIRREKAASNLCTNQALSALGALIAMLWYGKEGLAKLAMTNYKRAAYLKYALATTCGTLSFMDEGHFNEFVVDFKKPLNEVQSHFQNHGILPGIALENFYPEMKGQWLLAVTETKSKEQLDFYIQVAASLMESS